eukprot:COSAG05_NODE_354_length_10862_cov_59.954659_3_plen_72_part_00
MELITRQLLDAIAQHAYLRDCGGDERAAYAYERVVFKNSGGLLLAVRPPPPSRISILDAPSKSTGHPGGMY